jgi:hypothetical protein
MGTGGTGGAKRGGEGRSEEGREGLKVESAQYSKQIDAPARHGGHTFSCSVTFLSYFVTEFLHLIAGHRYQQQSTDPELFHRGYSQLVH